jgi:hypothetical protein
MSLSESNKCCYGLIICKLSATRCSDSTADFFWLPVATTTFNSELCSSWIKTASNPVYESKHKEILLFLGLINNNRTGQFALMMEAASTSKMSVNFYQTTQCKTQKTAIFILAAVRTWNLIQHHFSTHGWWAVTDMLPAELQVMLKR